MTTPPPNPLLAAPAAPSVASPSPEHSTSLPPTAHRSFAQALKKFSAQNKFTHDSKTPPGLRNPESGGQRPDSGSCACSSSSRSVLGREEEPVAQESQPEQTSIADVALKSGGLNAESSLGLVVTPIFSGSTTQPENTAPQQRNARGQALGSIETVLSRAANVVASAGRASVGPAPLNTGGNETGKSDATQPSGAARSPAAAMAGVNPEPQETEIDSPLVTATAAQGNGLQQGDQPDPAIIGRVNFAGRSPPGQRPTESEQIPPPRGERAPSEAQRIEPGLRIMEATVKERATDQSVGDEAKLISPPNTIEKADGQNLHGMLAAQVNLAMARNETSPETGAPNLLPVPAAPGHGHELLLQLSQRVAELKQSNLDSMAVVLRPDSQTELFLRINRNNGGIDIQAQFERGDLSTLSAHWDQLQKSLAAQGIRLGDLQFAPGKASDFLPRGGGGSEQNAPERQPPALPEALSQLTPRPPPRPLRPSTSKPLGAVLRRWESWA